MKLFKFTLILSLVLPSLIFSGEARHVDIGSRPMSEEAKKEVDSRKSVAKNEQEDGEIQAAGSLFDRYPPVYYSSSHHWLSAVTYVNNHQYTLELEDGSVWKTSGYDGAKALSWRITDPLIITQNNRWFSSHDYRIINQTTGASVEATLFLGPIQLGEYSRFIVGIDHLKKEILLNDGTYWTLSYLDTSLFSDWALNDYIIIGSNSNTTIWDSGSEALLINVNMNNACRAKQF